MRSLIARIFCLNLMFWGYLCLGVQAESKKTSLPNIPSQAAHTALEKKAPLPENILTRSTSSSSKTTGIGKGTVTGLPLPRFVSLKSNRVNLRAGPGRDYPTTWVFQKAALPVEIIAEFETWRRIRDSEGTEGWVLHSLLSGRRTALVMPWAKKGEMTLFYKEIKENAPIAAQLAPGVLLSIKSCTGTWCSVSLPPHHGRQVGYVKQDQLWGAYPQEEVK